MDFSFMKLRSVKEFRKYALCILHSDSILWLIACLDFIETQELLQSRVPRASTADPDLHNFPRYIQNRMRDIRSFDPKKYFQITKIIP